jgi:RNA polymerase sigma factor (sigma-70 family)
MEHSCRNRVVIENLGLAYAAASKLSPRFRLDYDDTLQLCCLGLIKAVERFKPSVAAFSTYAFWLMNGEVMHWCRDSRDLVRAGRNQEPFGYVPLEKVGFLLGAEANEEDEFDLLGTAKLLPPGQREIIEAEIGGLSVPEIADRLKLTQAAVYAKRKRAIMSLRQFAANQGFKVSQGEAKVASAPACIHCGSSRTRRKEFYRGARGTSIRTQCLDCKKTFSRPF